MGLFVRLFDERCWPPARQAHGCRKPICKVSELLDGFVKCGIGALLIGERGGAANTAPRSEGGSLKWDAAGAPEHLALLSAHSSVLMVGVTLQCAILSSSGHQITQVQGVHLCSVAAAAIVSPRPHAQQAPPSLPRRQDYPSTVGPRAAACHQGELPEAHCETPCRLPCTCSPSGTGLGHAGVRRGTVRGRDCLY